MWNIVNSMITTCHILKIITLFELQKFNKKTTLPNCWSPPRPFKAQHFDPSEARVEAVLSKKSHFNVLAKIYTIKLFTQTQTLISRLEFYQHWHVPNITNMLAWFSYTHSNIFAENIMWKHADWITSFRIPLEHRRTRERIKNNNSAKIPRNLNVFVS